jgi:hypothetical protein
MPRRCLVCESPRRGEVEQELLVSGDYHGIGERYGLGGTLKRMAKSLDRHWGEHMGELRAQARAGLPMDVFQRSPLHVVTNVIAELFGGGPPAEVAPPPDLSHLTVNQWRVMLRERWSVKAPSTVPPPSFLSTSAGAMDSRAQDVAPTAPHSKLGQYIKAPRGRRTLGKASDCGTDTG